jgi:glycine/D-amino acid oxidase-like deaminating enzyme
VPASVRGCLQDKQRILEGCYRILPSLREAEVVADWAGLRPYREPVRIELEHVQVGAEYKRYMPTV